MNQTNFPRRRQARQEAAKERVAARAERSSVEQLKVLDQRLGEGVGALRERARLKAGKPAPKVQERPALPETSVDVPTRPRDRKGASKRS